MKRNHGLIAAVIAVALAVPAVAGDGHKCTMTAQDCLNQMAASYKDKGWAGFELDKNETTGALRVKKVLAGSPAEAAGIQEGDVLLALNGVKLGDEASKEKLMAVKKSMKAGSQVTYTINRAGKEKAVAIALVAPPQDVIAGWIGAHMLEHAGTAVAQN